jgi:formylglycine-generating enzyme required for sulfatase activity
VCEANLVSEGEPCGDETDSTCSAPDTCDGAGACTPNDAADGTVCDDCAAGSGNCGECRSGICSIRCLSGRAPVSTDVTAPDGSSYRVDATEVTNAQYCEFLAAGAAPQAETGAQSECLWNATFEPGRPPEAGRQDHPVAFVDWCDAYAYCEWRGQRLCGAIGGGANAFAAFADPASSQWYNACSSGGATAYPYGASYDGLACNGADNLAGAPIVVSSLASCEGGFPGIFDLSGNVLEWEDSCDGSAGGLDGCHVRGGSYLNPGVNLACADGSQAVRETQTATLGFRCCD